MTSDIFNDTSVTYRACKVRILCYCFWRDKRIRDYIYMHSWWSRGPSKIIKFFCSSSNLHINWIFLFSLIRRKKNEIKGKKGNHLRKHPKRSQKEVLPFFFLILTKFTIKVWRLPFLFSQKVSFGRKMIILALCENISLYLQCDVSIGRKMNNGKEVFYRRIVVNDVSKFFEK